MFFYFLTFSLHILSLLILVPLSTLSLYLCHYFLSTFSLYFISPHFHSALLSLFTIFLPLFLLLALLSLSLALSLPNFLCTSLSVFSFSFLFYFSLYLSVCKLTLLSISYSLAFSSSFSPTFLLLPLYSHSNFHFMTLKNLAEVNIMWLQ